jgi:transposase InsO family protein
LNKYNISLICSVLNISRQTYYKYKNTVDKDYFDYLEIKEVFVEGLQMYGYRRIKKALLLKHGWIVNHKKILRIMKKYGMKVRYKNIFKINYTKKAIEQNIKPDLIRRDFHASGPNEKWSTDITYITHNGRRAYLSSIMDLYTKNIISYKISFKMNNELVIDTLNNALSKQKDVSGVILHSDQGAQYTSSEYKHVCESNGINISMSNKATPADNAPIESFHANLKRETLYSYNIISLKEYIALVKEWILFYNTNRIRLS